MRPPACYNKRKNASGEGFALFQELILVCIREALIAFPWRPIAALAAGLGAAAIAAYFLIRACSFRLILHLGDGTTVSERHPGDCRLDLYPLPPREGYRFVGWFRDEACTEPVTGILRVPRRGAELYARWKAELPQGSPCAAPPLQKAEGSAVALSAPSIPASASSVSSAPAAAPLVPSVSERAVTASGSVPERAVTASGSVSERAGMASGSVPERAVTASGSVSERAVTASGSDLERAGAASGSVSERAGAATGSGSAARSPAPPSSLSRSRSVPTDDDFTRALLTTAAGELIFLYRRRSFLARLALADGAVQDFFREVRAALLSFAGVRERIGWGGASYAVGRTTLARIAANAKSLVVCLALDPRGAYLAGVHFADLSARGRYASVPVRCKVTGRRSLRAVLDLVRELARLHALAGCAPPAPPELPPPDPRLLAERGLICVVARRENGDPVAEEELRALLEAGATLEKFSSAFALRRMRGRAVRFLLGEGTSPRPVPARSSAARALVNLDTIAACFADGARVDLETLREKGLIGRRVTACKILARGRLDKVLTVEAEEFSRAAERLIAQKGGKAVRVHKGK